MIGVPAGVVHFADSPKAYADLPDAAKQFLSDVPAAWDETTFVDGTPGTLAILARRNGSTWWVGAISGSDKAQTIPLDLSFLGEGEYDAVILRDGAVPKQVVAETALMRPVDHVNLPLLPHGGFAMRFTRK